jgi:hypothetical protein
VANAQRRRPRSLTQRPGDNLVTVSQIAAALAPIVDYPAAASEAIEGDMAVMEPPDTVTLEGTVDTALVERIRHWTRERLLLPAGELHTGRGKHRCYPVDSICEAALLQTLTTFGLTWRYLSDALAATRSSLPTWRLKGGPLFLLISREGTRDRVEIVQERPQSTADLAMVVNLAQLFARVGGGNNGPSDK